MPNIIFRADGNREIGLGHLVRCGALASGLRDGFTRVLLTRNPDQAGLKSVGACFQSVVTLDGMSQDAELKLIQEKASSNPAILVLDGYHFSDTYIEQASRYSLVLVVIDDLHNRYYTADAIVNSAGGVTTDQYNGSPWTQYFMGPAYTMLRPSFIASEPSERHPKKILVCMGGADPHNYTEAVLQEVLTEDSYAEFHVVLGAAYQHIDRIRTIAEQSRKKIFIHQNLSEAVLADLMRQCGTAICSASGVAYEYLAVGGALFVILTASNQRDLFQYLVQSGLAFDWKQRSEVTPEQLEDAARRQRHVFDGQAPARFERMFQGLLQFLNLTVRRATASDLSLFFAWTNDPAVRANSFQQETISPETHTAWFTNKLKDATCYMYVLEDAGVPIAQVRFQVSIQEVVVNFSINSDRRGKGLGSTVLSRAIKAFTLEYKSSYVLVGFVKASNLASQRIFERLRFGKKPANEYPDSFKYVLAHHGSNTAAS